jgi:hypothetical protein
MGRLGEALRRIGSETAYRLGYHDQEIAPNLMTLFKRPHADPPIRFATE